MSKIIGIDSGTFDPRSFSEQDEREEKDRLCAYYIAPAGGRMEFVTLKRAITSVSGPQVLSVAYVNAVDATILEEQYAVNSDQVVIPEEVYEDELNNPESPGYLVTSKKKEVISKITKLDVGETSNTTDYVGEENDYMPIKLASQLNGTVFIADYHEASNAYCYGVPFVFPLFKEQIKLKEKRGECDFREHFFKRIINKWTNKKFN